MSGFAPPLASETMAPKLKGYEFGEEIGKGSGGVLMKAIHLVTEEIVAVKILCYKGFAKKNHGLKEKCMRRGRRELFLAIYLKHPYVMGCYEGKMLKNRAYLVMEYMEGGNLESYLKDLHKRKAITEELERKYFRQLIHGIHYCHNQLLVHRDIKPRNLLLDASRERLRIADFGISNYMTSDLTPSTFCGTGLYQPLETMGFGRLGLEYSGTAVDVYSCGVTLFHILNGSLEHENFNFQRQLCYPKSFSTNAIDLITRMTAKEPKDRITILEVKNHTWFQSGGEMYLHDPYVGLDQRDGIDNDILLKTMNEMQCDREDLIQSLIQGEHTKKTVMYQLLKKKKMRGMLDQIH